MPRQQIAVGSIVLMVWSGFATAGCDRSSSAWAGFDAIDAFVYAGSIW